MNQLNISINLLHGSKKGASYNIVVSPTNNSYNRTEDEYIDFILERVVPPILFGIITLLGILGNVLVVHVIRARQKMRTVTNLLLLNLAIADLSFVVVCPPFTAYQLATSSWPFHGTLGNIICKLMHYLVNVTVYVTIYTLVLISIIRYMTVVHNTSTSSMRTKKNIVFLIVTIWFVMLTLNIPILFSYEVQDFNPEGILCENLSMETGKRIYATFFVFAYLLPLSIIAILSVCILNHIRKNQPVMINKKTKSLQRKRQATQLIILIIVIFAIFWLPVHIHLLVAYFHEIPSTRFYKCISLLWNCLAYFNSCVNPIIYNYTSKEFRDSFRDTVLCAKWNADWDREVSFVSRVTHAHNGAHEMNDVKSMVTQMVNGNTNNNPEPSPEEV